NSDTDDDGKPLWPAKRLDLGDEHLAFVIQHLRLRVVDLENKLKGTPRQTGKRKLDYPSFWGKITQMGLTEVEAHEHLGAASVNDWLDENRGTLEGALQKIVASVAQSKTARARQPAPAREPTEPPDRELDKVIPTRTQEEFNSTLDLLRICSEDFGMASSAVFSELGYPNQKAYDEAAIENPFISYLQIKSVRRPESEGEIEPEDLPF
ncbi:hypothetical protein LCGC14_2961070, partial [marine sediment metagenome]